MKLIIGTVVIALILILCYLRRVVEERRQRYGRQVHCVRVFKPNSDPFNPSERIEIYHHKN